MECEFLNVKIQPLNDCGPTLPPGIMILKTTLYGNSSTEVKAFIASWILRKRILKIFL